MRFTRLYIEKKVLDNEITARVIDRSKIEDIILIDHYKDVFNRPSQDIEAQVRSGRSLILARNAGNLIYEGGPLCQDFGYGKFYYSTSIMGCVFDCDYCFLKGMYKTSSCVIFVNFEDYSEQVRTKLKEGPMYLCVSYESDLTSFDNLTGLASRWEDLACSEKDLTIELRTKAAPSDFRSSPNIIYAFTLSPQPVIDRFEHGTAPLLSRISSVQKAIEKGATVRLCFDPLICTKDCIRYYNEMMDTILLEIDLTEVRDIGIGTFRIPADYIKDMRKAKPQSAAVMYPFENINGVMRYPSEVEKKLLSTVRDRLQGGKIYEI